jgi:nucleotide-binding universal stress UspA family protein
MKTATKEKGRTKHFNRVRNVASPAPAAKIPVKLEHILVPIDFSEHSLHALRVAEGLAKSAAGNLTLLYVVEPMMPTSEWAPLIVDTHQLVKSCQRKLEALPAKEGIDPQLIGRVLVKVGIPWNEIVNTARELNRDAIVIATHGYSGWKHVFMGSTAERVVRHASCPVLVVR